MTILCPKFESVLVLTGKNRYELVSVIFGEGIKKRRLLIGNRRLESKNKYLNGGQSRNRTKDTGIFSPLLYQLS